MKIQFIKTGEVAEVYNGFAARLIEQGKAIPAEEKPAPKKAADKPAEAKAEKKKATK